MSNLKKLWIAAAAASMFGSTSALAQFDDLPADAGPVTTDPAADPVAAPAAAVVAETAAVAEAPPPEAAPPVSEAASAAATLRTDGDTATPVAPVKVKAGEVGSPLRSGGYFAPLITVQSTLDDPELSEGLGGVALLGYRRNKYALETGFGYNSDSGIGRTSWKLKMLLFPFDSVPFLYGVIGGGVTRYTKYPIEDTPMHIDGRDAFETADLAAGLGYIFPMRVGNYEFGLRGEALYELGDRFLLRENDFQADISAPSTYHDVVVNLGLVLPFEKAQPPPPPPAPVVVTPPAAPVDSDGDGVPDDLDKCPDTAAGVKVDANGCQLNPCKTPEAGERISLAGCATGDSIVLRGVNFEFDNSRLTANAETILDQVASELMAHPAVTVELSGHTDSLGPDDYNQRLSERRAESVKTYLVTHSVDAERMTAVGAGETAPVDTNETDEGRERNRRVELKVLSGAVVETSTAPTAEAATAVDAPVAAAAEAEPVAAEVPVEPAAETPPPRPAPMMMPSMGGGGY